MRNPEGEVTRTDVERLVARDFRPAEIWTQRDMPEAQQRTVRERDLRAYLEWFNRP